MTLEEFRKSGILEMYILGKASDEEVMLTEKMLSLYPDLQLEMKRISLVLEQWAKMYSSVPSPEIKAKIIRDVRENKKLHISEQKKSSGWVVAVSLLVLGFFISGYLWLNAHMELRRLKSEFRENQEIYDSLRQSVAANERLLAALFDPGNQISMLDPTERFSTSAGLFYSNPVNKRNYFQVISLPEITADQSYQLWSLKGDQAIPLNVFRLEGGSIIELEYEEGTDAYAITIEPRTGRDTPSLDRLIGVMPMS